MLYCFCLEYGFCAQKKETFREMRAFEFNLKHLSHVQKGWGLQNSKL